MYTWNWLPRACDVRKFLARGRLRALLRLLVWAAETAF